MSEKTDRNPEVGTESPEKEVRFGQDFFQVQMEFAAAASKLQKISFPEAMTEYTNLFNFIADGEKEWEKANEAWNEFVADSKVHAETGDMKGVARIAHEKYDRPGNREELAGDRFGCFSYSFRYAKDDSKPREISIHFQNRDAKDSGPLSASKRETRRRELFEMFKEIRTLHPNEDFVVKGASWLYNIPQYKELFPKRYQESMDNPDSVAPNKQFLQNLGLWGQFLKADGTVNAQFRQEFQTRVQAAKNENELLESFPVKVRTPKAPVSAFYQMVDEYERHARGARNFKRFLHLYSQFMPAIVRTKTGFASEGSRGDEDLELLAWVFLGEKPACKGTRLPPAPTTQKILARFGLKTVHSLIGGWYVYDGKAVERIIHDNPDVFEAFGVRTPDEVMLKLSKTRLDKENSVRGLVLGFPRSAVDAYAQRVAAPASSANEKGRGSGLPGFGWMDWGVDTKMSEEFEARLKTIWEQTHIQDIIKSELDKGHAT